jgi:hypothetical protein
MYIKLFLKKYLCLLKISAFQLWVGRESETHPAINPIRRTNSRQGKNFSGAPEGRRKHLAGTFLGTRASLSCLSALIISGQKW